MNVFKTITGVTYPLCRSASSTGLAYGVTNEWHVVVDQQGIIRLKIFGPDITTITATIDQLLASTGVSDHVAPVQNFVLYQNYPNPFNPATRIAFELARRGPVSLSVYTARGELLATLADDVLDAGRHEFVWQAQTSEGKVAASGVYFYELRTAGFSERKKMLLLR